VVIQREAYCHGKLPPWAIIQGLEKCRFGIEKLSTADYIELSTLQDESVVKPWITLEMFDKWRAMNKTLPSPTTSTKIPENPEKGEKATKKKQQSSKKNPAQLVKSSVPFSYKPSATTSTTTTTYTDPTATQDGLITDITTSTSSRLGTTTTYTTVSVGKEEYGEHSTTGWHLCIYSIPINVEFSSELVKAF
jgi:hypothetical protein